MVSPEPRLADHPDSVPGLVSSSMLRSTKRSMSLTRQKVQNFLKKDLASKRRCLIMEVDRSLSTGRSFSFTATLLCHPPVRAGLCHGANRSITGHVGLPREEGLPDLRQQLPRSALSQDGKAGKAEWAVSEKIPLQIRTTAHPPLNRSSLRWWYSVGKGRLVRAGVVCNGCKGSMG